MAGKKRDYAVNVYPTLAQRSFLGVGSIALNQAIGVAETVLRKAHDTVPLTPAEWAFLGMALPEMTFGRQGHTVAVELADPASILAELVQHAGGQAGLVKKIRSLNYPQTWAVITALQNYHRLKDDDPEYADEPWWTPAARMAAMMRAAARAADTV